MRETIQLTLGLTAKEKNSLIELIDKGKEREEILEYAKMNFLLDLEGLV